MRKFLRSIPRELSDFVGLGMGLIAFIVTLAITAIISAFTGDGPTVGNALLFVGFIGGLISSASFGHLIAYYIVRYGKIDRK